ncbi:MAG: YlxR family protein [Oscillospiraceae bacterium]
MQTKKQPLRMCLGCREMKPKQELVRVVKNKDGEISLDLCGKAAGRGAYVCKSTKCFNKALKACRFERAFSGKIPSEITEKIELELKKYE